MRLSILSHLAILAMEAGLDGRPMPSLGPRVKPEWIEILNSVYAAARKRLALQTQ